MHWLPQRLWSLKILGSKSKFNRGDLRFPRLRGAMWSHVVSHPEVHEGDTIYRIMEPVPKQVAEAKLSCPNNQVLDIFRRLRGRIWNLHQSQVVENSDGYRVDLQRRPGESFPTYLWAYQGPHPHPGGTSPTWAAVTADQEITKFPAQVQMKYVKKAMTLSLGSSPRQSYHIEIQKIKKKDRKEDKNKVRPAPGRPKVLSGTKVPSVIQELWQQTRNPCNGKEESYVNCFELQPTDLLLRFAGGSLPLKASVGPEELSKLDTKLQDLNKSAKRLPCGYPASPAWKAPHATDLYGGVELHPQYSLSDAKSWGSTMSLLAFDPFSGRLFQYAAGSKMVFTDFEMISALRWVKENSNRGVAFSLEPIDPKKHDAGDSVDGLFQEKWYSHESLKTSPFGYWMWRADWKLKQLAQGALYDDETKTSQPLEPGITVPEDYPDPCESQRVGRSRSWIVCRGITLRVIGENLVVIHPDDVQMGVEERRMVLNEAKNQFEDAVEQPSMASPEVRYLDRNYDKVANYHVELLHCKRMAMLLAVANYFVSQPLQGKSLRLEMMHSVIPEDFGDRSVPVIKAVHRRGLEEEAECQRLKQELNGLKREEQQIQGSVDQHRQMHQRRLERLRRQSVDKFSKQSVDAYNLLVDECEAARKAYNTHVEIHSATVQRLNGVVDAFNQAVAAYNARNFCRTVKGGVDLEVREKVEVKRLNVEEHEMLKHFRVLAEEVHADESQKKPHAYVPTVVEDIEDQEDVHLNIWRLTSPTKPAKMELEQQVVLHSLKQAALNGRLGLLKSTMAENGRYDVQVDGTLVKIQRRNFLLPSEVCLSGLSQCSLNGLCGQIVAVQTDEKGLRYVVNLLGEKKAVRPSNVLFPVGSTVTISCRDSQHDGKEVKLQEYLPLKDGDGQRTCRVKLPSGESFELAVGCLLA